MDKRRKRARFQRRLLDRAQRRLNRLMDLMAAFQSQNSDQEPGEVEDGIPNNLTGLFTRGLSLSSPGVVTTTFSSDQVVDQVTPTSEAVTVPDEQICRDIRGRDRVCCNTAVTCFDDLTTVLDDLSTAKNDFSLLSACRVVSSELRKDKRCVSNALSRCSGPGRSLMHSRLDNRLDALYDQFYKHCRKDPFPPRSPPSSTKQSAIDITTSGNSDRTTAILSPIPVTTNRPTFHTESPGGSQTTNERPSLAGSGNSSPLEYGAILAGALTGGVILLVVLIIAVILWCRNRREDLGSDSSAGIIFYKPRHAPRPMPENNNKPPLLRQESDHYAEIDERLVNPNMRPSLPPELTNLGYINPVGDGQSINYFQPESYNGVPMATTRGQLSYGAILASNTAQPADGATFYHSSPVIGTSSVRNGDIHNSETLLSPRRFMSQHRVESNPNSYVTGDSYEDTDQDDYEQPISANSSLRYSELNRNDTPDQIAPSPPNNNMQGQTKAQIVHQPSSSTGILSISNDQGQPTPSPRRPKKGKSNGNDNIESNTGKPIAPEVNKIQVGPRDSTLSEASTKSSHHYFVLEPGSDRMDYENSVSQSKLV